MDMEVWVWNRHYSFYQEDIAAIWKKGEFPHEIGLFLGYPVEDVKGFIKNRGKNCLYSGYWKVYGKMAEKAKLFERFDYVRELMVLLVYHGAELSEIIDIFHSIN